MSDTADLAGATLGRYRLHGRIGEGLVARVYRGVDNLVDRPVAVKVLHPSTIDTPGDWERLMREVELVSGLAHPHILETYDHGATHDLRYLAMALETGGTLDRLIAEGPLDPSRVVILINVLADALHRAHEHGAVHRDLKPGNVLFNDWGKPFLSDFGFSRTGHGIAGTPGYISPEVAQGQPLSPRANVYSLAVMAFEMLSGTWLFAEASLQMVMMATVHVPAPGITRRNADLPPEFDRVLSQALSKKPEDRPLTTIEFAEALSRIPLGAAGGGPPERRAADQPEGAESLPVQVGEDFDGTVAGLSDLADRSLVAAVMVDEAGSVVDWNQAAAHMFGWSAEEIIGRSLATTLIAPDGREALERGLRRHVETGDKSESGWQLRLSAVHTNGREMQVELSIAAAARFGHGARILAFIRDLSREVSAQRLAAAQARMLEAIDRAHSLEAAAPTSLRAFCEQLGWSCGALWIVDFSIGNRQAPARSWLADFGRRWGWDRRGAPAARASAAGSGQELRCSHFWAPADDVACAELREVSMGFRCAPGVGLPGRAWALAEVVWVEDLLAQQDRRTLPAARAHLRSAVAVPVLQNGEVRAVVEFFTVDSRPEDEDLVNRMYDLGARMGRRL